MIKNPSKSLAIKLETKTKARIEIGSNILNEFGDHIDDLNLGKKVAIISHENIFTLYGDTLKKELDRKGLTSYTLLVPNGEGSKSLEQVQLLIDQLLDAQFERNDTIIALGGGVIGDLAGFVAAIYLRGINFIQIPTTLLAQVDSSVGGKTGVNHKKGKNLIGAFYQPALTLIDVNLLASLPEREIRCGLAEIIKYGIIRNEALFGYIEEHQDDIKQFNISETISIWQHMIEESCKDKAWVVTEDEKESNLRAILNFGHTIGHAIEAYFDYGKYLHGEAVAIGMNITMKIAADMGLIAADSQKRLENLLVDLGFELKIDAADCDELVTIMHRDKKVKNGKIRFVLPIEIGAVDIRDDIDLNKVKSALMEYTKG